MRIKEMLRQHRRDFTAVFECESCHAEITMSGYDDENYHTNVIPKMVCKKCGEVAPKTYVPNATKYPEGVQV